MKGYIYFLNGRVRESTSLAHPLTPSYLRFCDARKFHVVHKFLGWATGMHFPDQSLEIKLDLIVSCVPIPTKRSGVSESRGRETELVEIMLQRCSLPHPQILQPQDFRACSVLASSKSPDLSPHLPNPRRYILLSTNSNPICRPSRSFW